MFATNFKRAKQIVARDDAKASVSLFTRATSINDSGNQYEAPCKVLFLNNRRINSERKHLDDEFHFWVLNNKEFL